MGLGGSTQQGLTIRRHAQLDQQTCILVLCWCSRILFPRKSAIEQRFPTSRRRLHRSGRCASHRCSPLTPVVRRTNSTPAASLSLAWPCADRSLAQQGVWLRLFVAGNDQPWLTISHSRRVRVSFLQLPSSSPSLCRKQ
jgi:hypothetical protein